MKSVILKIINTFLLVLIATNILFSQPSIFPKGAKWYLNDQQWIEVKNYGYTLFEGNGDTILEGQNSIVISEERHPYSGDVEI